MQRLQLFGGLTMVSLYRLSVKLRWVPDERQLSPLEAPGTGYCKRMPGGRASSTDDRDVWKQLRTGLR